MTILIEINNGQPIPFMWYIFILLLLFFRILALENVAKILTLGPRLPKPCKALKQIMILHVIQCAPADLMWYLIYSKMVSMFRKYHTHKLQTNPLHREEEPHNNHETPERQTK